MTSSEHVQHPTVTPQAWLRRAGAAWFAVACCGQLAFVAFILGFYGARTARGDYAGWNDKPLIDGYIAGDGTGNLMFISHVLLASVMTASGLAQMVPQIRMRARAFHRWNGRVFLVTALTLALGGLWLTWVRGTALSTISAVAISGNAILILACAGAAWRAAVTRAYDAHARWAMRLFLVANGVWFLRIGMMAWVLLNQGPRGMSGTLSGPVDVVLVFGCYLIPLAVLELYFAARRPTAAPAVTWAGIAVVAGATVVTALGAAGAVALMWGPYL